MMTTNGKMRDDLEAACIAWADAIDSAKDGKPATVETCPLCSKRWVKVDGARPHACGAAKPAARNDSGNDRRRPNRGPKAERNDGRRPEKSHGPKPAPKKIVKPSPSYREAEAARVALKREFLETSSASDKTTDWKKGTRETKSGIVYRERGRQVTASRGGVSVTFYR